MRQHHRRTVTGLLFVAPSFALFLAFVAVPVVFAFYISFNDWSMLKAPSWAGVQL